MSLVKECLFDELAKLCCYVCCHPCFSKNCSLLDLKAFKMENKYYKDEKIYKNDA